ncbi:MAG: chromosome segregation protein SMC [Acidobacteriota bacterium]|nr:MAG: chromosome segregation protein SMC [Acidobacteriota bacterium]
MFKLQRLEITGFKSFADHTEIVFTGNGITAVVGPNGCGKSNVSDAISWVLGEQRAKSLRGGEMKDVVFAGTKDRKPGGMAEVVLHLVRDDSTFDIDEGELEDIDERLSSIDDASVDMNEIEGIDPEPEEAAELVEAIAEPDADQPEKTEAAESEQIETVKALAVGSAQVVQTKVKTKRHWRPRSFALDFAPGEAVSVTRRLYLSGESEYMLNGKTCRLRDITDLFAGTGLSGAHYAIIEQGRIGQILSAKPADRRSLIEEAAGISKFRARQRAAESRLESAKTNLARIYDIVSEVETRVNSLRRQAAKTRRFKLLQEEFRGLLRTLYAAEGRHFAQLSDELRQRLAEASKEEEALHQQLADKENAAKEQTLRSRTAEESLAELRKIHSHNALERDRAEREHLYKSDQLVSLNTRCESLRGEIAASKQRIELLATEIERLRGDEQRETAAYQQVHEELTHAEEVHAREASALAEIETKLDELRTHLIQHTAAAERFDEIAKQLDNNIRRLNDRAAGLDVEGERAAGAFTANQKTAEELAANLAEEEAKLISLNAEKETLMAETAADRDALRAAESALQALQEEHSAKKHRLETLKELEEKRAVYAPQVQKILNSADEIGVRFHGVLADRLHVTPDAESAIESLFGPWLEAICVESVDDAKRATAWLRSQGIGRAAMVVLPPSEQNEEPAEGIAGVLGISKRTADALSGVFAREMSAQLVDALPSNGNAGTGVYVDRSGDILIGGRLFISGDGNAAGQNDSLLAFKRELTQLAKDTRRLVGDIEASVAKVESARSRLIESESKMVDLQSLIIKVDRGIHGLQIQVLAAKEEIERAERHRKLVADEAGQIRSELAEIEERKAEALSGKTEAEKALTEASSGIEALAGSLAEARSRTHAADAVLNEKRMTAATSDERRRAAVNALRRVENESREFESRLNLQSVELAEAEGKIRSLHEEITAITDRIANSGVEVEREDTEIADAIAALSAAREASDRASEELAELNRQAAEARDRRAEIEVRQAEAATELKNVSENCVHELNIAINDLMAEVELPEELDLAETRRHADDLRDRLEGFGAINMLALEELAEAEERHQFLTSQRQDIVDSIAATEEALREIKQRSRERFKTAFEAINQNFTEFFRELFGGGQGEMTLLESDDILDAGIEIVAQPPGKRLQNILLLSGGEKAMTAIALVLAIFKYRPSPFCLLDEVDAPLDDANVGRFAQKVADMSERTQFIVITHNKKTMEAARALYGVTMQEPGVSKIVSVKFD